ncbi:methyltransferase domain-containing protein [Kitasatospora sp. NPDC085879]|uniref:methyltransferase domain-containing protein n=1 Tax=Kitasatospora sp. NPDC085879 TaxID=3154769 RepID=UPI0034125408
MTLAPAYLFDNRSEHAAEQHRCLAEWLDPISIERLVGAGVRPGLHCLDVGTGAGSIAVWLADRVGPAGRVLATDLAPLPVPERPNLVVQRHDILHDPLPEAGFDLIHVRLVLSHLPEREEVLHRLLAALRPGGVLHLVEFDAEYAPVLLAPDARAKELFERFQRAKLQAFRERGSHQGWGRECAAALRRAGFTDVEAVPYVTALTPGSPGLRLQIHTTRHLREPLLRAGLTDAELAELREVLAHPDFRACSNLVHTVHGRRP